MEFSYLWDPVGANPLEFGDLLDAENIERVADRVHARLDRLHADREIPHRVRVPAARLHELLAYLATYAPAPDGRGLTSGQIEEMAVQTVCDRVQEDYPAPPRWDPKVTRYEPDRDIQRADNVGTHYIRHNRRQPLGVLRY
jgi:hypothetical protein